MYVRPFNDQLVYHMKISVQLKKIDIQTLYYRQRNKP